MIIVTGASKGLGRAICERLISKKNEVLMILDKKNLLLSKNDIDVTQEILDQLNNKLTKISIE